MNEDNIEKAPNVPPFVRYVASTIPMVFDNSLSYYEALAALAKSLQDTVDVVNNNGTVTEEYIQLTKDMKEYMDHYFDNLNVQEEINNKLDQMVENGEFQSILDAYVTPTLNEMKSDLEGQINNVNSNLQTQISALGSGSPLVATSVAGMTDTSKVYVNTTDGKWYYYNGSSWKIGGTYQTAGIADDSISGNKIKDDTIVPYSLIGIDQQPTRSVFRFAKWYHGYRWFNGTMTPAEGYVASSKVPVYAASGITYTPKQNMVNPERISKWDTTDTWTTDGAITTAGWTPSGVGYLALSLSEANFDPDFVQANTGNNYLDVSWIKQEGMINNKLLVYGDSLWSNCKGNFNYTDTPYHTSTDTCFGYQQYLESIGFQIDNQAVSGSTIIDCWNSSTSKAPQVITSTALKGYDGVILSFGRNDSRNGVPMGVIGNPSDTSFDEFTYYGAFRAVISTLLQKNPKLKIYLWSMTQSNGGGFGTETVNSQGLKEIDYVDALHELGKMYSAKVLDMYRNCGLNELTIPEWTFEGVHLTNEGYAFTSQYYLNEMKNNA